MPFFKALLGVALAIPVLSFPIAPYSRRATGLAVELSVVGDTEVKAVVTNTGAETVSLLNYGSFLDPNPVQKVEVYQDDVQVPFTGVLIRYRTTELNQDAFTTLAPGASYETVINIAALHAVQGGDYRVVSSGAIPFAAPNSNELAGAISFQSNSLTISLDDEAVAQTASVIPALDRRTILTSCSGSEDAVQRAALEDAAKLATAAAEATDASNNASLSKFSEYFKTTSSSVRSSVAARLRAVASEASSTTSGSTRYYCSDEYGYCQPNVLAYAIPSLDVIANCPIYYTILEALTMRCHAQDRASTTLHEFTHTPGVYSPGTKDYAYGYAASVALDSSQAVNNADTYALYANAIYAGC